MMITKYEDFLSESIFGDTTKKENKWWTRNAADNTPEAREKKIKKYFDDKIKKDYDLMYDALKTGGLHSTSLIEIDKVFVKFENDIKKLIKQG
jgi:hypothetical protein